MKAHKALKRLAKIEALISNVSERYSPSELHIRGALRDAKAAFTRAKEAVSSEVFPGKAKTSKPPSKAASAPPKRKRRLSAAGRKAIREALARRWAQKKAAASAKADRAKKKKALTRKKASIEASAPKPINRAAKKTAHKKTEPAVVLNTLASAQAAPAASVPVQTATEPIAEESIPIG